MGFFDLQVNGYAGVDFNGTDLDPEFLEAMSSRLLDQDVDGILVTVTTDSLPSMIARLKLRPFSSGSSFVPKGHARLS
jgi:N-acetylglucosamine-6-phosphate deacetylase